MQRQLPHFCSLHIDSYGYGIISTLGMGLMWFQRRAPGDTRAAQAYSVLTAAVSPECQLFQLKLRYSNSACLVHSYTTVR